MMYNSTRDKNSSVSASQAILQGISEDGGLFVPDSLPRLDLGQIEALKGLGYQQRAALIAGLFLPDFSPDQINDSVKSAYEGTFEENRPAPLKKLPGGRYVLELFRGPTCAFKDMALRLLPQLMRHAAKNTGRGGETLILVATSGDTGKAALEGFRDADGVKIMVFYPVDGVSPMQKLQMATQEGGNVEVCAVRGNFDNAQSGVKDILTSRTVNKALNERGVYFSSANSINWGRLLPQIVYYFSAYADLLEMGEISLGEPVNFVVPTGNFGNILAAYYAKMMGLPVGRLICASNSNDVLTDFIRTGEYSLKRDFHQTISPSMDILISSNLERLLYHLLGEDDKALRTLMQSLGADGCYTVPDNVKQSIKAVFYGGSCDDTRTLSTIKTVYETEGYLLDTHTAVAAAVASDYVSETGDSSKTVIVSTASPYKFAGSVYNALSGETEQNELAVVNKLCALTGVPVPHALAGLSDKPVRFDKAVDKDKMTDAVMKFIE